jgi:hypothetical protein
MQGNIIYRNMTGPNTQPERERSPENPGDSFRKSALSDLLEVTLEEQNINGQDPEGLNTYEEDTTNYVTKLKTKLKAKRDNAKSGGESTEWWASVTDAEIDGLSIYDVNNKVVSLTKPLVSARSRLFSYIRDIYPDIRNYNDWESKIQKVIHSEQRSSLEKMIKWIRGRWVQQFLSDALWVDYPETILQPSEKKKLEIIFGDLSGLTPPKRKRAERIFYNWNKYSGTPWLDDIAFLLEIKRQSSDDEKRRIIKTLAPTLPLPFLKEHWLITDDEIERALESVYGKIYRDLNPTDKTRFKDALTSRIQKSSLYRSIRWRSGILTDFFMLKKKNSIRLHQVYLSDFR